MDKNVRFTVIDPKDTDEYPLDISPSGEDFVIEDAVRGREIPISTQQMGELGVLLLALAGKEWDVDSGIELLDGYGMTETKLAGITHALNYFQRAV
jgi:hypothetical protein